MSIEDIVSEIKAIKIHSKVTIIAIEGFGGSGKSTLAHKLKEALQSAYVISIDDFIIKEKVSDSIKSNFDRERLEKEVLLPLKQGRRAVYRRLLWDTNTLSTPMEIPNTEYLILEGVSTFHPDIIKYMDYKIWVETEKNTAKQRGSERDRKLGSNNDSLWEHWTATYQEFKNLYHPEKSANSIYYNN